MHLNKKYLSILEFAQREGINIKTINRWIKQGKIAVIKAKGKSKYRKIQNYIHYSYLGTKEAQEAFLKDRGLLQTQEKKSKKDEFSDFKPWEKREINKRKPIITEYFNLIKNAPKGKLGVVREHFKKIHNYDYQTVEEWIEREKIDGPRGLIPKYNPGIQKRILKDDKEAVEFIKKTYMTELGPTIQETYERYCKEFGNKRDKLFSHTTVADFIKRNWTESERMLARDPDEWQKKHGLYVNRDWDKVELNEVWFSDAKQIDIACLYNGKVIFPWLTAFMDAKSRKFVGWVLTATPDKWAISQSFDHAIAAHGVPKVIYIDRGKPYKSYMISGKKIKSRVIDSFENIEREPFIGLFREAGSEVNFAYPRRPQEKIIEGNFGCCTDRNRDVPGNRSWDTKHRPKKLEKEIKKGKLLTFDQLKPIINKTINERNARPHSTTKKSPNSYYENYVPVVPSESFRAFLKMDRHWIKIRNSGVKIGRDFYRGEELWRHSGEVAECRRDPTDIRKCAIILNGELLEIAHLEPKGHYRSEITLKNRETVHKINQNIRRERKRLIQHEEEILTNPDPLKAAMEMDAEVKLKPREIRPASKVTALHKNEKLSREVIKELEKSEPEIDIESEAATANKESIFSKYAAISKRKRETPKPRLRLIPREKLTMFTEYEED